MLCFLCNQALGNVRDDVKRLEGLIAYLDRAWDKAHNIQTFEPAFPIDYAVMHGAA